MKHIKTEGIVIKRKNLGEADKMLTLFTRASGKISIKAVGVRKITSKRSAHIELLNHIAVTLYQGKAAPLLLEVQTLHTYQYIKNDLMKIGYAYHICELIDGLCAEGQENEQVFRLLEQTLTRLETTAQPKTLIQDFEVSLLSLLGFYTKDALLQLEDTARLIEHVIEKRLKSKQLLHRFI